MAKAFPRGAGEDEEGEEEPSGSSESPGLGVRSGVKMEAAMGALLGGGCVRAELLIYGAEVSPRGSAIQSGCRRSERSAFDFLGLKGSVCSP